MAGPVYLDTSAVLRATLEVGTTPEMEQRIHAAPVLLTSRLSLVESARAVIRIRETYRTPEESLALVERQLDAIWSRCEIWELTPAICELACRIAPRKLLRALDALHLATFLAARRRFDDLELLTADERLRDAATT